MPLYAKNGTTVFGKFVVRRAARGKMVVVPDIAWDPITSTRAVHQATRVASLLTKRVTVTERNRCNTAPDPS